MDIFDKLSTKQDIFDRIYLDKRIIKDLSVAVSKVQEKDIFDQIKLELPKLLKKYVPSDKPKTEITKELIDTIRAEIAKQPPQIVEKVVEKIIEKPAPVVKPVIIDNKKDILKATTEINKSVDEKIAEVKKEIKKDDGYRMVIAPVLLPNMAGHVGDYLTVENSVDGLRSKWESIPDPDLTGYVPYTGATDNIDLGYFGLQTYGTSGSSNFYIGREDLTGSGVQLSTYPSPTMGVDLISFTSGAAGMFSHSTGGTRSVTLCNDTYAISATGGSLFTGDVTVTETGTFGNTFTGSFGSLVDGLINYSGYFSDNSNFLRFFYDGKVFRYNDDVAYMDESGNALFNDLSLTNPVNIYTLSHNSFADYLADEHIDWTNNTDPTKNFSTVGYGTFHVGGNRETSIGVEDAYGLYTADGTNTVTLADGTYAISATGTITATSVGLLGTSVTLGTPNEAAYFEESFTAHGMNVTVLGSQASYYGIKVLDGNATQQVYLCDGTYSINATGNSLFTGAITSTTTIQAEQLTSTDDVTMAGKLLNTLAADDTTAFEVEGTTNPLTTAGSYSVVSIARTFNANSATVMQPTGMNFTITNSSINSGTGSGSIASRGMNVTMTVSGAHTVAPVKTPASETNSAFTCNVSRSGTLAWKTGSTIVNNGLSLISNIQHNMNIAGGALTSTANGFFASITNTCPAETAGTHTTNAYGFNVTATGTQAPTGTSYGYGGYLKASGSDNNYGLRINVPASVGNLYGLWLDTDNTTGGGAIWFGAGLDSNIGFDGNSLNIIANAVTATDTLDLTAGAYNFSMSATQRQAIYVDGTTNDFTGTYTGTTAYFNYFTRDVNAGNGNRAESVVGYRNDTFLKHTNAVITDGGDASAALSFGLTDTSKWTLGGATGRTNNKYGINALISDTATYDLTGTAALIQQNYGSNFIISASPTLTDSGGTGGTSTFWNYGLVSSVTITPTVSTGTWNVRGVGISISVTGNAAGNSTNYGLYIPTCTGADNNYAIYDLSSTTWVKAGGDFLFRTDGSKFKQGAGDDVYLSYTGTYWDFYVSAATTSIRFNQGQLDTDFIVYGDTAEMLTLDAGTLGATFGGGITPASMADAAAANNTIYYSTTASKLVYKDSGGTVNALY